MKFIEELGHLYPGYQFLKWDDKSVKHFWDFESLRTEKYFSKKHGKTVAQLFGKYFKSDAKILDFGAGPGFLTDALMALGHKTAAFDLSPQSIARLNDRLADAENYLGGFTAENMLEHAGTYDALFMLEVVEHLYADQRDEVFKTIHGLLAPEGVFVMTCPNEEDLTKEILCCPTSGTLYHRRQHVYSYDGDSLSKLLNTSGFEVLEVVRTHIAFEKPGLRPKIRKLKRQLRGVPPENLLIVARKK